MPEVKITRTSMIIVKKVEENTYGDMIITPVEGEKFKIGNKRIQYFDFQEGLGYTLNWAMSSFGKEYVYSAIAVADQIKPKTLVEVAKQAGAVEIKPESQAPQLKSSTIIPSGQEIGMTTKELGDMIRAKMLSIVFGEEVAKKLLTWYINRIKNTTGIS